MNALNIEVQEGLRAAAAEASERRDVSAVIVYGGEKVFAAGADIKEMQAMSYTDMVERSGALQSAFTAVARIPKPTVAAVTGYALGGGCELALACDFRVVGDNARLGQPEILLGAHPRRGRHPAPGPPGRSGPGQGADLQRPVRGRRRGAADRAGRRGRRRRGRAGGGPPPRSRRTSVDRRTRCVPRRRPSTGGSRSTSTPAWRSSGCSSPACSRPGTVRSASPRSSSTVRARPASKGDEPVSWTGARRRGERRGRPACVRRHQAGPGALPRLGGADVRREVVDLLRRPVRGLRP